MIPGQYARALLIALLLTGCASAPVGTPASTWVADDSWWEEASRYGATITGRDGTIRDVRAERAANVLEVSRRLRKQSGVVASITLVSSDTLNAFASEVDGERRIGLTIGLLNAFGDDKDALATTIGHELAHLYYGHPAPRKQRNQLVIGDSLAIAGIMAVNTSFSRFEEREADIKGMEWALDAGFSPCGSARTMRILEANGADMNSDPYLATHPGHAERIKRANAMSRTLKGKEC